MQIEIGQEYTTKLNRKQVRVQILEEIGVDFQTDKMLYRATNLETGRTIRITANKLS